MLPSCVSGLDQDGDLPASLCSKAHDPSIVMVPVSGASGMRDEMTPSSCAAIATRLFEESVEVSALIHKFVVQVSSMCSKISLSKQSSLVS